MKSKSASAKVVIIGDASVGKTSIRQRYLTGTVQRQYKTTIGADFVSKTVETDKGPITLSLWDTAGSERFKSLAQAFYRGSDAVVLVFSIIDRASLQHIASWYAEFRARTAVEDGDITWVCIGNKCDLGGGEDGSDQSSRITAGEAQELLDGLISSDLEAPTSLAPPPVLPAQGLPNGVVKPPHYSTQGALLHNEHHPLPDAKLPTADHGHIASSSTRTHHPSSHNKSVDSSIRPSSINTSTTASIYHTPAGSLSYSSSEASTIRFPGALQNGHAEEATLQVSDIHDQEVNEPEMEDDRPMSPLPAFNEDLLTPTVERNVQLGASSSPPLQKGIKLFLSSAFSVSVGASSSSESHFQNVFAYVAQHIMDRLYVKQQQDANSPESGSEGFTLDNVHGNGGTHVKVGDPVGTGAVQKGWKCC